MAKKVLCIEIGYSLIRVVELTRTKKPRVSRFFDVELPENSIMDGAILNKDGVSDALKEALAKNKVRTKQVIFSINSSRIANREITLPNVKANKLAALIEANAEEYFPVNLSEYEIAHKVIGNSLEDANKKSVMVYLAPKHLLKSYQVLAESCALSVVGFDYVGNSLYQAVKNEKLGGVRIVVKVDENTSLITILNENQQVMQRNIAYGVDEIIRNHMEERNFTYKESMNFLRKNDCLGLGCAKEYDMSVIQALINGVQRALDFYGSKNPEHPVTKIRLTGMGGDFLGLAEQIETATGIDTKVLSKLNYYNFEKLAVSASVGEYISGFGAAIEPLGFISEVKKTRSIAAGGLTTRTAVMVLIGCIFISVAMMVSTLFPYMDAARENREKTLYLNSLQYVVNTHNEYAALEAENRYLNALKDSTVNHNSEIIGFIEELEEKLPSNVQVSSLIADEQSVIMSMEVASKNEAANVFDTLSDFESFSEVIVTSISDESDEKGVSKVSFTVQCTYMIQNVNSVEIEEVSYE